MTDRVTAEWAWRLDEGLIKMDHGVDPDVLVDTLDLEDIPGDAMAVYELQATPVGLSGRIGDRQRIEQRIEQIDSRVRSAVDRV